MHTLENKTANLPNEPGVYLYKNSQKDIVYIGKAKSLRNRVRTYFQESHSADIKLDQLRSEIADLEFIVVDNEMEALALENNLIKQHKPKYNILLRDDLKTRCVARVCAPSGLGKAPSDNARLPRLPPAF